MGETVQLLKILPLATYSFPWRGCQFATLINFTSFHRLWLDGVHTCHSQGHVEMN